jgi:transposase InsO family protein
VPHSDNGGEYVSRDVQDYPKECGIVHQRTVPYAPEQNGVAERANRMIGKKARSMLADKGLSKKFWTRNQLGYLVKWENTSVEMFLDLYFNTF